MMRTTVSTQPQIIIVVCCITLRRSAYGARGNYSVHDADGKKNTSASFIGHINPLRYRGYYYDRETRLYYLQSRYYDFANYRFINADTFATTDANGFLSANMFAYCENNPIIGIDPTGEFAWLIGAVAGAAVNVATSVITQLHDGGNVDIGKVVVSGICGAVAGAGLPKVGGAIVGAATSLIDNISSNWGDASLTTEKILDAVVATGFGALTGAMGSSVNAIKLDSAVSTVKSATKVLVNGGRKLFKKQAKKGLRKAGKYIGKSFFTYLAENSIYSGLAWGTSKYARASYRSFRR